jgi:hypothetical protein
MSARTNGFYWLVYDDDIESEVVEYFDGWIYSTGEELKTCLAGEEPVAAQPPFEVVRGRLFGPLEPPGEEPAPAPNEAPGSCRPNLH